MLKFWGALALILMLIGTVGCDSAGEAGAGDAGAGSGGKRALRGDAARLAATMVRAVSAGEGESQVDVRFELAQRPEVGKPVDVAVALVPNVKLERMYARFQPGEGLELLKGEQTEQVPRPVLGTPVTHSLTVVPKRDGIFTVTATVLTDTESESISRNFSIPVIAGSGLPAWDPKSSVARSDNGRAAR